MREIAIIVAHLINIDKPNTINKLFLSLSCEKLIFYRLFDLFYDLILVFSELFEGFDLVVVAKRLVSAKVGIAIDISGFST